MTVNVKAEELNVQSLKTDILDLITNENRNRVYEMLERLESQVNENSFNNGYDTGYNEGYDEGYVFGYDEGYRQWYSEGWLGNDDE